MTTDHRHQQSVRLFAYQMKARVKIDRELIWFGCIPCEEAKFSHSEGEDGRTVSLRMSWQNGVSVVKPDTPFNHFTFSHPPTYSFPSGNHHSVIHVYTFSLIWLVHLFCFLILFFYIYATICMKPYVVCLSLSDFFTWHNSLKVRPCCLKGQDFTFLWLNNILVYLWISHIFIHSSISGHVGCFHNTKMNIGMHISFLFLF